MPNGLPLAWARSAELLQQEKSDGVRGCFSPWNGVAVPAESRPAKTELANPPKDILDRGVEMSRYVFDKRCESSGGNGARKGDGKMRLPRERNCHPYVTASLPGLLVAEAFQRRDEFRAAQAPWQFHACITSSRT